MEYAAVDASERSGTPTERPSEDGQQHDGPGSLLLRLLLRSLHLRCPLVLRRLICVGLLCLLADLRGRVEMHWQSAVKVDRAHPWTHLVDDIDARSPRVILDGLDYLDAGIPLVHWHYRRTVLRSVPGVHRLWQGETHPTIVVLTAQL